LIRRRAALFADDVDDDFVDPRAQQLLAVAVGGGGSRPHAAEVGAERQQVLRVRRG
jgi:hypothetical protein